MTGHGGFAAYLFRFKLKNNAACACDPDEAETSLHLITKCPIYGKQRYEAEEQIQIRIDEESIPEIMASKHTRDVFVSYCKYVVKQANKRNRDI